METQHPVIEHLAKPEFWASVRLQLARLRSDANVVAWLEGVPFDDADMLTRLACDRSFAFCDLRWFEALVTKHIFSQIGLPAPLTIQDLKEVAVTHLAGVRASELQPAAERFVCCAELLLRGGYGNDKGCDNFDLSRWTDPENDDSRLPEYLWESPAGMRVSLWYERDPHGDAVLVWADSEGVSSRYAAKEIMKHLQTVFPVFLRTIRAFSDEPDSIYAPPPPLSLLLSNESKNLFAQIVGWDDPEDSTTTRKDKKFEERIENAISLLKAADEQERPSIGSALCFSAIESLVCEKSEGIVEELSRHVASLLQPNRRDRPDAIEAVRELYKYRCKLLHGEIVDDDHETLWVTRRLASAVVSAAIEWKTHCKRMGSAGTRKEFVEELRTISQTGDAIVGVPDRYHRYLPLPPEQEAERRRERKRNLPE